MEHLNNTPEQGHSQGTGDRLELHIALRALREAHACSCMGNGMKCKERLAHAAQRLNDYLKATGPKVDA